MTDILTLTGSLSSVPADPSASGLSSLTVPFSLTSVLFSHAVPGTYDLTADSPQSVSLGALAGSGVHVIQIQTTNPITVRLTSSVGTTQSIPIGSFAILFADIARPFTALDVTRSPGVETFVDVVLGQLSQ